MCHTDTLFINGDPPYYRDPLLQSIKGRCDFHDHRRHSSTYLAMASHSWPP